MRAPLFSDYVIYVDESGDHGMVNINPRFPVFVLTFCIFKKQDYCTNVVPKLARIKFKHFGHDTVVLHEHDIRKRNGPFRTLNETQHASLLGDLGSAIDTTDFTIIAAVIRKDQLQKKYATPTNPYEIAMMFCLERANRHLEKLRAPGTTTHVVAEARGANEDRDLELEFRRICGGSNKQRAAFPFELTFAKKAINSTGLQFADLTARPIGLSVVNPSQPNQAFDIIKKKLRRSDSGSVSGYGLKVFP